MTLRPFKAALFVLVLAGLAACGTAPGKCSTNTDCATGTCDTGSGFCVATCGNTVCSASEMCANSVCVPNGCSPACTTGQTCELDAGTYACVQTDCVPACDVSYQECNKSATPPACVATTCHPACGVNEECKPGDGGFACNLLTAGAIVVTQPTVNTLTGVSTPLAISATAGAPNGGPRKVKLAVKQSVTDAGASLDLTTGNSGVYAGNVSLADAGFKTGNANVVGTVYYLFSDGGTTSVDSPAVQIQIDVDPPTYGAPVYDKAFYSGAARPMQTANVTLAINDVGPANVNPSSVILTSGTQHYPASSTAYPDGGNGNYLFAVTVSELSNSNAFLGQVPYSVTATDKVGNASTLTTGTLAVDNIPPSFGVPVYDAGWYGGDASIAITVDVKDQTGGSEVAGGTVALVLASGATLANRGVTNTSTYNFSTTGAAIRPSGQGPVLFNFIAADNAGNVSIIDGGQILVDEQAPTVGATAVGNGTAHAASNGWFAQDGGTILITTLVNDGNGSGPASASLVVGGNAPVNSSSGTVVAAGTNYSFAVPTSVQMAGSETPVAIAVSGTDVVGNAGASSAATDGSGNAVTLLIDGKAPLIMPVAFTTQADGTDTAGVRWFSQVGGTLNFSATITDSGSLVNAASVSLLTLAGAPVGVSGSAAGNVYTFMVPRSSSAAGLIAAGAQGIVSLQIVAKDNVGNTSTLAVTPFGIDGQKPSVSFLGTLSGNTLAAAAAPSYPASGSNCAAGVDFCGHDSAGHFWRKGELNKLAFYGNDGNGGSGVKAATASAGCSIGSTADCTALEYVSTDGSGTAKFDAVPNFGNATFTTASDGTGTINTTITVKDLVGNSSSTTVAVNVTRVKWIKKMAGSGLINLSGSPIVTSTPTSQIIFAGLNSGANPIASFDPTGALLWQAGHAQGITGVTSNMAYSSATKTLYVVPSGTPASGYAFVVPASGAPTSYASFSGSKLGGAPAIIVGPDQTEYVLVSDNGASSALRRLEQYSCAPSSGVQSCVAIGSASSTWSSLTSPTTDGANVYLGHDSTLTKVPFTSGALGTPVDSLSAAKVLGAVAVAGSLYVGDFRGTAERYRKFSINAAGIAPTEDSSWIANLTSGASSSGNGAALTAPPVVSNAYVFGSFDNTSDGHLYGYSVAAGSSTQSGFIYPASTSASLGNISPVAIGKDNSVYFTDDANSELVALTIDNNVPTAAWKFTGNGTASLSSVTGEPTIDASAANAGTIYFGDSSGNIFALITDSGGPLAPTAGSTWPRVGFDNCNSGNTSVSCQ